MLKRLLVIYLLIVQGAALSQELSAKGIRDKYNSIINSDNDNLRTFAKIARTLKRDVKSQASLYPIDTKAEMEMETCVECREILKLTNAVNEILEKTNEAKDPKSATALELGNLKAIAALVEYVDENSNKDCYTFTNRDLSEEFTTIDKEELTLEFSQEILINFSSGQFYNAGDGSRVIWLRGVGKDLNKVVRVDIDKHNRKFLTYYTLKKVDPDIKIEKEKEVTDYGLPSLGTDVKVKRPSMKDRTSGKVDYTQKLEWASEDNKDYLKMTVGPDMKYKYYVPSYISLLSIHAENEFFDQYLVKSKLDINTKRQKGEVKIIDGNDGQELFTVTAKPSRAELSVPYDFNVYDSYNVLGRVGLDTKGSQNFGASLRDGDDELLNTQYSRGSDGVEIINIGTMKKVSKNGTLSLKLEKRSSRDDSAESAWVNYELKF